MNRRSFCQQLFGSGLVIGSVANIVQAETPRDVGSGGSKVKWQKSLKAAQKLAIQQDKPMMIVFGASWCTFCHKLERETLTDRQTVAFIEREFIPVHLDFDKDQKVAKILEAEKLPCTVILTPHADLLLRSFGFAEPKEFRATLASALEKREEVQQASSTSANR